MLKEVTFLEDESRWGVMLGILQRDMDKCFMILESIVKELGERIRMRKLELSDLCISDYESDGIYRRCLYLYNLLGGILMVMRGSDGMLSSLVIELLRNFDSDIVKSK